LSFRIPDEKISEIRDRSDIVEVISEAVRLKKTGRNFIGLCPFHSEKTASFTVNPDKQIFHCFGCQEGGDVFSFLMKNENLSYPEAVKSLARRFGITVAERPLSSVEKGQMSEREKILEINRHAVIFFRKCLNQGTGGEKAAAYLKRRGVDPETLEKFHVGYAPEGWDHLLRFLSKKNIPSPTMQRTGLVIPRKTGDGVYDRFRNRVMFPIFDVNGIPIGFGGRSIDDALPKYLNSPETPVYHKSRSLYGLNFAKKRCRETDTVFIVEGYLDCISLHQFGIENAVATLGTALTADHLRMVKGHAEKIILVFDSDDAGIKAAVRSVSLFMKYDNAARILVLPENHDPDSYIRAMGPDKFRELSEKASSVMGFLMDAAVKKHGMTVEGKIAVIHDMIKPLASITDTVARSLYIKALSERVDVPESAVMAKLKEFQSQGKLQGRMTGSGESAKKESVLVSGGSDTVSPNIRSERRIISMMLQFPEILTDIERHDVLSFFRDDQLRSLGMCILKHIDKADHIVAEVLNDLDDDENKRIVSELGIGDEAWQYQGCIKLIQKFVDNSRIFGEKDLIDQIRAAEKNNDHDLLIKLLSEKQRKAQRSERLKMSLIAGR